MIRRPIRRWFPLFMGPMVCAFIIGFVYPFCKGIYLSFCKFKVTSDAHFVGFENYRRAFQDASFVHSFWFTALFAVISLVLINVLAFAVAYALTQGIKGSNLYRTVFFMPNLIGGIVLGALLAVGGLWLLLGSGTLASPGLQRVLAVLAIAAGAAFARQMLAPGDAEAASGAVVCASMPIVLLAFWLIVSYKVNIINPTVSAYAVEILALCAALIASYEFAGFAYGRPKAIKSIFWSQFAAFLCITALPDDRAGGQQLMLAAIAGILLFQSYLTASNIRPAVSGPVGGAQ